MWIILFIQFITGFFLEVLIYLFPQRFGQFYCPFSRRHQSKSVRNVAELNKLKLLEKVIIVCGLVCGLDFNGKRTPNFDPSLALFKYLDVLYDFCFYSIFFKISIFGPSNNSCKKQYGPLARIQFAA